VAWDWVRLVCRPLFGLLYQPGMIRWLWSSRWDGNWQGKLKYFERTCHNTILSTINSTWPDLGSNPGRRDGNPATNHFSYGTAFESRLWGPHRGKGAGALSCPLTANSYWIQECMDYASIPPYLFVALLSTGTTLPYLTIIFQRADVSSVES
jgi:hypothetical protein